MRSVFAELEKHREEKTESVVEKCEEVSTTMDPEKEVIFEVKVGDPTPSSKHDLVHACYDFEADTLVLGSKGLAHNLKEHLQKDIKDFLGSVPGLLFVKINIRMFVMCSNNECNQ